MPKELRDAVEAEYHSLGSIGSWADAGGHAINSKNYVLTFAGGKKLLCKYLEGADEGRLSSLLAILEFCRKKGAKVPALAPSDSGREICTHGQGLFYLRAFHEGGYFSGGMGELEDFASSLAKLHHILKACTLEYPLSAPQKTHLRKYVHPKPEELERIRSAAGSSHADVDRLFLANFDFLKSEYASDAGRERGIDRSRIREQYVHGDLHPLNVIFNGGRTEAILDFDGLSHGALAYDVSFACFRFAMYGGKDSMADMKTAAARARVFLGAYEAKNPLDKEERRLIGHYFIHECLNRISYILRDKTDTGAWNSDLRRQLDYLNMAKAMKIERLLGTGDNG